MLIIVTTTSPDDHAMLATPYARFLIMPTRHRDMNQRCALVDADALMPNRCSCLITMTPVTDDDARRFYATRSYAAT